MDTINLTTTEFRQNQKKFLDMAANGAYIIIHRGKELFMLNRVQPEKMLDDETMKKIDAARLQFSQNRPQPLITVKSSSAFSIRYDYICIDWSLPMKPKHQLPALSIVIHHHIKNL